MLFPFGCAATLDQKVDNNIDSRILEKRVDDLTSTINLIVNDGNKLHNEMEEAKGFNKDLQEKVEGLEATVRNLNARIVSIETIRKTKGIIPPSPGKPAAQPRLHGTENSKSPDKTVNTESIVAIAKGFWDAMNAKDIEVARSYTTKESGAGLQIKDNDDTTNCKATFGGVKIEDNKATIETTLQGHNDTSPFEVYMQTILVTENGQWKVDASQTMMSVFGGAMAEAVKGLGNAMAEGFKKGTEEMGTLMTEGMKKGVEEMTPSKGCSLGTQTPKPEITLKSDQTVTSEQTERESFLRENIVRLAAGEFPDNSGILWTILGFEHKAHLTYVEVEPKPSTVGYPRFKFVVSFASVEKPKVIATYCLREGRYALLSIVQDLKEDLPKELP